jgi:hypothetical protein
VVGAARRYQTSKIFVVQMDEDADVESVSFDERIASYWADQERAAADLVSALRKYYPIDRRPGEVIVTPDIEARYRDLTLRACDIVDLANLPEGDRHLATRELELRRLYVALRMRIELPINTKSADRALEFLEARRLTGWDTVPDGDSKSLL